MQERYHFTYLSFKTSNHSSTTCWGGKVPSSKARSLTVMPCVSSSSVL